VTVVERDGGLQTSLRFLQRENSTLRLLIAIHDRLGSLVLEGARRRCHRRRWARGRDLQ
jgi:hypothetical protein